MTDEERELVERGRLAVEAAREARGNRYRVVHFIPDQFLEGRLPVAVLVAMADLIHVIPVPAAQCAVPPRRQSDMLACIEMALCDDWSLSMEALPVGIGPHYAIGPIREIPPEFGDPIAWVEKALFRR